MVSSTELRKMTDDYIDETVVKPLVNKVISDVEKLMAEMAKQYIKDEVQKIMADLETRLIEEAKNGNDHLILTSFNVNNGRIKKPKHYDDIVKSLQTKLRKLDLSFKDKLTYENEKNRIYSFCVVW